MLRYVFPIFAFVLAMGATYAQSEYFNIERQAVILHFEHDLGFPTGMTTFELGLDCSSGVTTAEPLEHVQALKDDLGLQLPGDRIHMTHMYSFADAGPQPNEWTYACVDGVMRFYHHASEERFTHTCRMRTIFGPPDAPSYAPHSVPQDPVREFESRPDGYVGISFWASAQTDPSASNEVGEYCFINDSSLRVTFGYSVSDLSIGVPESPAVSYDNESFSDPDRARLATTLRQRVSYADGRSGYLGVLHKGTYFPIEYPQQPHGYRNTQLDIPILDNVTWYWTEDFDAPTGWLEIFVNPTDGYFTIRWKEKPSWTEIRD